MANELTIQTTAQYTKNGATFNRTPASFTITVAGDNVQAGIVSVGTSPEAIPLGDIATPGYLLVHNLDATNYIQIGYDATGFKPTVKVAAGKWGIFQLDPTVPQWQANTGACLVEFRLFPV